MDIRKAILIFAGTLFVALGVLGIFLPLMPTTVFLLMAAYCYSRSSERFHSWLLNNRWLGGYIRNYRSGGGMSVRQKVSTLSLLWASMGFSIWIISAKLWVSLLLVAIALGVTIHILWIKTYRREIAEPTTEPAPAGELS
ncbi:MAG: YbaN family protein [Acidobacteria bacterium]|nr:YbaN family protein [Acidobacteriota bacterium]